MTSFSVVVAAVLHAASASAVSHGPLKLAEVPEPLKAWVPWALYDSGDAACPFMNGSEAKSCAWPGRLSLSLVEKGGTFTQGFFIHRESLVPLPGDERRWPQSVKVDGRDAVVTPDGTTPMVRLAPGEHTVTGAFAWDSLPEALALPKDTGLLSLTVRGAPVSLPNRDDEGRVFLQKETVAAQTENLEVTVLRLVTDEIPLTLTTRLELSVSGKSREVLLGRALPEQFVPMTLASDLPTRIEADGKLRLQVRPGRWTVTLVARHDGPVNELKRVEPAGTWQEGEEVWVFDARPSLRQVLVEGVTAVDPTQTRLPPEWKRFPAYAMGPTDAMRFTERRRGDSDPSPDLLALSRALWLDFDGTGYTVSDKVSGQLRRSWRLQMQPRTELGRVVASGADQSITRLSGSTAAGVELRQGHLALEADSRIVGDIGRIPAVSWDADFSQVHSTLQLPPGWRLLHASGADDVSQTWVHDWTLLDIFLVLVVAVAIGRLFGLGWGALALVTLTLSYNEDGAPQLVWLFVLAGEALVRVLPNHWVRTVFKVYRLGAWAALALICVTFMVEHVRHGLYPALERDGSMGGVQGYSAYLSDNNAQYARSTGWASASTPSRIVYGVMKEADAAADPAAALEEARDEKAPEAPPPPQQQMVQQNVGGRLNKSRSFNVRDYDKNAMVQTGPGLPRWEWNTVTLRYSGPVQRAQELSLWLLPPSANLVLALVRAVLLAALALRVFGFPGGFWPRALKRAPAAAAVVLVGLVALRSNSALAGEVPSAETLTELKTRLIGRPACAPTCASSPRLSLEATATSLRLRLEVLAGAAIAVPLPGHASQWVPEQVLLDGKPTSALVRAADGSLWLALGEGAHQVMLEGPLPARDTVQVALPLKPHRVEAKVDGWTLDGLHEDGLADESLQLSRKATNEKGTTAALQTGTLPPFVRVEREVSLGLQWTVQTTVVRVTPGGAAVVLEVPLLPGESVTGDMRVVGGKALVNMPASANEVSWSSVLPEKSPLVLEAPRALPWVEVWRLDVSPVWHVQLSGVPVIHQQDASGVRNPEWRPWPGETVGIEAQRPAGVQGQTATIDQSQLKVKPGVRATDATLTFNLRASRGGLHSLQLPDDAQLQTVTLNGAQQPIRQEGRTVSIPLIPGSQSVELSWRQGSGISGLYVTPEVSLGTASVNADLVMDVSPDRWVLFARGPRMGPAVLFWSWLLVLLLVSVGLSRLPYTPLKVRHWLLLALGLSQLPMAAVGLVFGWLLLLGWREKQPALPGGSAVFNLRQLAVVGVTALALTILGVGIYQGLLGTPDMQVSGNGSHATMLHWFSDRAADALPRGWVLSVPMLVYRGAMLLWSLWLALALLRWLRWGWQSFSAGGLWQQPPPRVVPPRKAPPAAPAP